MSNMWKRNPVEKNSWFFLNFGSTRSISLLFTLLAIVLSTVLFITYSYFSDDLTPDSVIGYTYAIVGTLFMLLAALSYGLSRRSHKRRVGQLNRSLHWHIGFGITTLALLGMHSFGNFNLRTGTYTLFALVTLVISGIAGRILDRIAPKLITHEVMHVLAKRGENHVELSPHTIQLPVPNNTQELHSLNSHNSATPSAPTQTSTIAWHPTHIQLAEKLQEPRLNETYDHPLPKHESDWDKLTKLQLDDVPEDAQKDAEAPFCDIGDIQIALNREEYYRAIIRYWRIGHIVLALVTVGLTLWHIEYAATLLLPVLFK